VSRATDKTAADAELVRSEAEGLFRQ
jgi:hypothetical protein